MTEGTEFQPQIFQPDRGYYIAPIRHHSPACAWALRAMIHELKPAHVLIEAPFDLASHIPVLLDPDTRPPVALVSLTKGETRQAAYYPFTNHSPEFVALKAAETLGAEIGFIDLPVMARPQQDGQFLGQSEAAFDSGDYVAALCRKLGCRDGFELWDHLFEARLGTSDWRQFFTDCGTYCAGLRAATPEDQTDWPETHAREAHMSARIAEVLAKAKGPVVAVVGGFHAPALTEPAKAKSATGGQSESYLIRYGYAAMDALAGYGAGLPQPGWYETLWHAAEQADGSPNWSALSAQVVEDFVQWLTPQGHTLSLPARVEALRLAEGLAALRGREGALRHDLMDGLATALVKGEASGHDVWAERLRDYLRGVKLGDVPASAGLPPLVEDARVRAKRHRFDISDGAERQRKLDIRRKASQLEASRFLYAMRLLDTGFARRTAGPDFVQNAQTDLLFEEWSYAWSPVVESRLIEAALHGDTLPDACLAHLVSEREDLIRRGEFRDLEQQVALLKQGVLAGLGDKLAPFLILVTQDIQTVGTFETTAFALRQLFHLTRGRGPLQSPKTLNLPAAVQGAYARLIYLCDDLPRSNENNIPSRLTALRLMSELLDGSDTDLNRDLYDAALDRVIEADPPPEILGAVLSCTILGGQREVADLRRALRGQFLGAALDETSRIGVLRGLLSTAPQLLWTRDEVLAEIDAFLGEISEAAFLELLPHMRLTFTALNPRETDRVADMLGALHGASASKFSQDHMTLTQADLAQGLAAQSALIKELERDGLTAWIGG